MSLERDDLPVFKIVKVLNSMIQPTLVTTKLGLAMEAVDYLLRIIDEVLPYMMMCSHCQAINRGVAPDPLGPVFCNYEVFFGMGGDEIDRIDDDDV